MEIETITCRINRRKVWLVLLIGLCLSIVSLVLLIGLCLSIVSLVLGIFVDNTLWVMVLGGPVALLLLRPSLPGLVTSRKLLADYGSGLVVDSEGLHFKMPPSKQVTFYWRDIITTSERDIYTIGVSKMRMAMTFYLKDVYKVPEQMRTRLDDVNKKLGWRLFGTHGPRIETNLRYFMGADIRDLSRQLNGRFRNFVTPL